MRDGHGTVPALLAVAAIAMAATPALAQATGGLEIRVTDADGPLPGASVTLSSSQGKVADSGAVTGPDGRVAFPVLAPGSGYRLEVSFPGHGTVRIDPLRVLANQTVIVPVRLTPEHEEVVEVTAKRDVVDLEKSTTSSKFSAEFIADLPVSGRFYQNVLTLAPGVQDANGDGNPNVHGSRARDFKAVVNGVANVDPLTGQFRSNVNIYSIDEMEVITAGAGPEYGRAQGGYANIIQKQGGNEFEGLVDLIYRASHLDGNGASNVGGVFVPRFQWRQPAVQLSGPIVRDRMWFRLSHQWIDREDPLNTIGSLVVVSHDEQINSDQITWQISERNKLAFKYDSNPIEVGNFGVSSLVPPESSQVVGLEADTYSLVWSTPYSPRLLVETTAAWQTGGLYSYPSERSIRNNCVSGDPFVEASFCRNTEDGTSSGSHWRDFRDRRERLTVRSDATFFHARKFLGMTHQLKAGFIVENERYMRDIVERPHFTFSVLRPTYTPGQVGIDLIGELLVEVAFPQQQQASAAGTTWGVYVKDQMRPAQNLTLEIGARFDREAARAVGYEPFEPEEEFANYLDLLAAGLPSTNARVEAFSAFEGVEVMKKQLALVMGLPAHRFATFFGPVTVQSTFSHRRRRLDDIDLLNNNLSPFASVAWDPWSDGKTKVALAAGRHYNNTPLIIVLQEQTPAVATVELRAERLRGRWWVHDLSNARGTINPVAAVRVIDRGLRTPYQDELAFTFQRELWAEASIALHLISRRYRDQFQDIDINHVTGDFGRCVPALEPQDPVLDPSRGPDGVLDDCTGDLVPSDKPGAFGRTGFLERPDGRPDLYTMNPLWGPIMRVGNYNQADYEGAVLEFVRRQYRGWEMQGSYTWSRAWGDGEDFAQFLGDDRSLLENEEGYQANDQRHVVKLAGTTITPWGTRLGGTVTWQSGLPYSLLRLGIGLSSLPPAFDGFGNAEPRERLLYETGVRNDQRNPSYWNFDVRAAHEFRLPGGVNAQLSLEVFNLLNDGTYIIYNEFFEHGYQINGHNDAYRRFGRRFQAGLKVSF